MYRLEINRRQINWAVLNQTQHNTRQVELAWVGNLIICPRVSISKTIPQCTTNNHLFCRRWQKLAPTGSIVSKWGILHNLFNCLQTSSPNKPIRYYYVITAIFFLLHLNMLHFYTICQGNSLVSLLFHHRRYKSHFWSAPVLLFSHCTYLPM